MLLPTSHSVLQTENPVHLNAALLSLRYMLRYKNCGLSHLSVTQLWFYRCTAATAATDSGWRDQLSLFIHLFILLCRKIIMIKLCNSSTV